MFDTVVQVELVQVKRILVVVAVQHLRGIVRHKGAKRSPKVVRRADLAREFGEPDPTSAARNDA